MAAGPSIEPSGAGSTDDGRGSNAAPSPGLARRLACLVYEGMLLFGVVVIAGYLYGALTQQRHALQGQHGLQAFVFLVVGIYFTWLWSAGRQTLAMKTWHLRLVDRQGRALSQPRAALRYLLSWLWFLPALAGAGLAGHTDGGKVSLWLAAGVLANLVLARLLPGRQYAHDCLAGTRLVDARPTASARGGAESAT
ncbi:MAG: RDD family protein [Rubrivivax sp.]